MSDLRPINAYDRVRAQLEADAWEIMQQQVTEGNIPTIEAARDKFMQWREAWMGGVVVNQSVSLE